MSEAVFEARRLGWPALVAPPAAVIGVCFFGLLAQALGAPGQTDRILSAAVQLGSLVGGIAAVSAVAIDPAIELRLSLPRSIRRSVGTRLLLAVGWSATVTAVVTAVLHELGRLTSEIPDAPLADHLEWFPPLLLMAGLGALTTVSARVTSAGAGIVAVAWVLSNIVSRIWASVPWLLPFWAALPFDAADPMKWYWNRLSIGLIGMTCLGLTGLVLGRSEHLLGTER